MDPAHLKLLALAFLLGALVFVLGVIAGALGFRPRREEEPAEQPAENLVQIHRWAYPSPAERSYGGSDQTRLFPFTYRATHTTVHEDLDTGGACLLQSDLTLSDRNGATPMRCHVKRGGWSGWWMQNEAQRLNLPRDVRWFPSVDEAKNHAWAMGLFHGTTQR